MNINLGIANILVSLPSLSYSWQDMVFSQFYDNSIRVRTQITIVNKKC